MRHRLFIPAATALLFALAACTQDELADGSRLSKEEYPIVIHATGLSVEATPLAAPSTPCLRGRRLAGRTDCGTQDG